MTSRPARAAVIAVSGVSKRYGPVRALEDVSLEVAAGDVYALLGLNGAGKTTLIRTMLSLVRPTTGSVRLFGRPLGHSPGGSAVPVAVWSEVGYLVETPTAYPELTVRENLEMFRRLRRVTGAGVVQEALRTFGLTPYADRRARTLSLGNQQRLGLAKALLHRPSLVVLDEPVNGLDPAGVVEIRTLLGRLASEEGVTVFVSSHVLGEVARLATRVGVLHQGRLIEEFATAELSSRVHRHLDVTTRDDAHALQVLSSAGLSARADRSGLRLTGDDAVRHPDEVATCLVRAGVPPTGLRVVEEDLESYFLRLVGAAADDPADGPSTAADVRHGR